MLAKQESLSGLPDHDIQLLSAIALKEFMSRGHTIEATSDLGEYEQSMTAIGARESHPMMSVMHHDFASKDALGLMLKDEHGLFFGGIAARFVDLGADSLGCHMQQSYRRHYGGGQVDAITSRLSAARNISGRIVYQGQWYMKEEFRGGGTHIAALFHYFHCLCFMKWRPDWVYGFFPIKLAERAFSCGYPHAHLQAHDWHVATERRGPGECLVYSSFEEFAERAASLVAFPSNFPVVVEIKESNNLPPPDRDCLKCRVGAR